jgi:hypothetical protein
MNMKNMITIFLITIVACTGLSAKAKKTGSPDSRSAYLGQVPPGDVPVLFAPGIVSIPGRNEATIAFSPDGTLCLFHIEAYPNSYTLFTEYKNGKWTEPRKARFSETRSTGEPSFSPDGKRIYFTSGETKNSVGGWDLWYVERKGDSWSDPVNLGGVVNSSQDEFHPCIVADGSLYFTNVNGDINRCQWAKGKFRERVILPEPINLKDKSRGLSWGDAWVAKDESIMIFKSNRQGGYGSFDNYISYKKKDGTWSDPKNLGAAINSKGTETAGDISPDGKYFFFGRDGDIYWVKPDFVETLR